jgi:hypothetical protein
MGPRNRCSPEKRCSFGGRFLPLLILAAAASPGGCIGGTTGREKLEHATDGACDTSVSPDVDAATPEDASEEDAVSDRTSRLFGLDALFAASDSNDQTGDAGDAGADGGEGGLVCAHGLKETGEECDDSGPCPPCSPPTAAALQAHNPACLTCARSKPACRTVLQNFPCEGLTTNAADGPAKNDPRSSLCLTLLVKELSTKCAAGDNGTTDCYCGTVGEFCFTQGGKGVAKDEIEAALETTAPATIEGTFASTMLGGGRANTLVQCLADNYCSSCF